MRSAAGTREYGANGNYDTNAAYDTRAPARISAITTGVDVVAVGAYATCAAGGPPPHPYVKSASGGGNSTNPLAVVAITPPPSGVQPVSYDLTLVPLPGGGSNSTITYRCVNYTSCEIPGVSFGTQYIVSALAFAWDATVFLSESC